MVDTKPVFPPLEAESWPIVRTWSRLDDLCHGVFDCPHTTPQITESGPFVVRSQDVRTGVFRTDQAARVSEETYRERIARAEPQYGDIVYSREGTYFGMAAEVPENERVCLGQRMVLIKPTEEINTRFLRLWLNSPILHAHIMGFRDGSVAERLNMPTIRGLPVPIIPLPEQRAIAATLGALDDKIELNRRMNETLEAMARALFRDLFVDFGPTRAKMAGAPPYLSQENWDLFPEKLDNDGKPEGWEFKSLGDVIEPRKGRNITKKNVIHGDVPVVAGGLNPAYYHNTSNISGPVITVSASGANAGFVRLYHQDIWASDCSVISREQTNYLFTMYALLSSRQEEVYAMQHGAAQPHIYPSDLKRLALTNAPMPIWQGLENLLTPIFELVGSNEFESHTLAQTRDLLLPRLMSGELRVADLAELESA